MTRDEFERGLIALFWDASTLRRKVASLPETSKSTLAVLDSIARDASLALDLEGIQK